MRVVTVRLFDYQEPEVEAACKVWRAALRNARRYHAGVPPLAETYARGWPYEALVDAAHWSVWSPAHPAHRAARRWGRGLAYRAVGEGIMEPGRSPETLIIPGLEDPVRVVMDSALFDAFPTGGLVHVLFGNDRSRGRRGSTLHLLVSEDGWRQGWQWLHDPDPEEAEEEERRLAWERWE